MKKIFIGTVGYPNLANHSIGPALLPQLQKMQWVHGVEVDELKMGTDCYCTKIQSLSTSYDWVILIEDLKLL